MSDRVPSRFDAAGLLRTVVLLAWACAFIWLLGGGRYEAYLRGSLWPLIAGGLVFVLLFLIAATSKKARAHGHAHGPSAPGTAWLRAAILLLPVVALAATPGGTLGSFAFEKRFVTSVPNQSPASEPVPAAEPAPEPGADAVERPPVATQSAATHPAQADASEPGPSAAPPLAAVAEVQSVTLLDLLRAGPFMNGRHVQVEGMVYRSDQIPAGGLVLFRFVVTCCTADAQGVGLLVTGEGLDRHPVDTWLRARGVVEWTQVGEQKQLVLRAASVEVIQPPDDPYLSPF